MKHWADEISAEMSAAATRYGQFASAHEAYGVLAEEVAELFDAIRGNNLPGAQVEAMQIAAVAVRLALACDEEAFQRRSEK